MMMFVVTQTITQIMSIHFIDCKQKLVNLHFMTLTEIKYQMGRVIIAFIKKIKVIFSWKDCPSVLSFFSQ